MRDDIRDIVRKTIAIVKKQNNINNFQIAYDIGITPVMMARASCCDEHIAATTIAQLLIAIKYYYYSDAETDDKKFVRRLIRELSDILLLSDLREFSEYVERRIANIDTNIKKTLINPCP